MAEMERRALDREIRVAEGMKGGREARRVAEGWQRGIGRGGRWGYKGGRGR